MYHIRGNEVVFIDYDDKEIILEGADTNTFEVLKDKTLTESDLEELRRKHNGYALGKSHWVAKDKNSVWTREVRIPGADPETFEFFLGGQCMWGQDKICGYCFYSYGKNRIKPITITGSLRFFNDSPGGYMRMYAFDDRYVYFYGRRCKGSKSDDCKHLIIENVQIDKLTGVKYDDSSSMISNNFVYYDGKALEGADAATAKGFSINEPGRGSLYIIMDRNTIYYEGKIFTPEINRFLYDRIPPVLFEWQKSLQVL